MNKPVEEISIKTPFFQYAGRKWGDSSGEPMLALHGWLDNAGTFDLLAPLLSDWQIVALDLPGHGLSAHRPPGTKYHYTDYIADVIAVADELGWDKFSLLGHSMGAGIASLTAGVFPERICKLIMIEGIGPMSKEAEGSPQYLKKSIEEMKRISGKRPPVYKDVQVLIDARVKVGNMERKSAEILIKRGTEGAENRVVWRSDPRLKVTSPLYMTDSQILAVLGAITVPTLMIIGESGYLTNREHLDLRCQQIKNLKFLSLPGGHYLHLDNPKPVAEAIAAF
ncbi:alpha/beta hydrolase [bacterium]|nr:alpha/beta hydrolase [bacterium]